MTPVDTFLSTALSQQARPNMSVRQFATVANALDAARDYFADRADVKGDAGDIPNDEMTLQIEIEQAQAALACLRKASCPACNDEPVFGR